jgi:hypothetical protein
MGSAPACSVDRLGKACDRPAFLQLFDDLRAIQQSDRFIAHTRFLLDGVIGKTAQRNEVGVDWYWMALFAFRGHGAAKLVDRIAAHLLDVSLALNDEVSPLVAMSAQNIELSAWLVDVELQVVVTEREEQILLQSREEVAAGVIRWSQQPKRCRSVHRDVPRLEAGQATRRRRHA